MALSETSMGARLMEAYEHYAEIAQNTPEKDETRGFDYEQIKALKLICHTDNGFLSVSMTFLKKITRNKND